MLKKDNYKFIALFACLILVYGFVLAFAIVKTDKWRHEKSQEYLSKGKTTQNLTEKMLYFEKAGLLDANENTYLNAGITALELGNNGSAEKYLARVKTAEGYFQLANAYYNLEKYDAAAVNYQKSLDKKKSADAYTGLAKANLKLGEIDPAKVALLATASLQKTEEVTNLLVLLGVGTNDSNVLRETNSANKAILVYDELEKLGYPQSAESVLAQASTGGYLTRDSLITLANRSISKGQYQQGYDYLQRAKSIDPYYPQIYQQLVIVCEKLGKQDEVKQYQLILGSLSI